MTDTLDKGRWLVVLSAWRRITDNRRKLEQSKLIIGGMIDQLSGHPDRDHHPRACIEKAISAIRYGRDVAAVDAMLTCALLSIGTLVTAPGKEELLFELYSLPD